MNNRGLDVVRDIAKNKGIKGDINISNAKGKRFNIRVDGVLINFGLWPYSGNGAFIDHRNKDIRDAWRSRHSKIMKNGKPAYLDKTSPEFYSWNLLW
jgi:hypothetical protein